MTEELRFDGKVAVVTGAGRSLGRAYAVMLAGRGAKVVVNNRSAPAAEETTALINAAGGVAVACAGDVGRPGVGSQVIDAALENFGRIDILVNNAGGLSGASGGRSIGSFSEISAADRDAVFQQNIVGSWEPTAAAWPHMSAQGYGRVVMTSSVVALLGAPGMTHYGAAKGAMIGLTKCLATEGAALGITVNVISPGAFTDAAMESTPLDQHEWSHRYMSPDSVAAALVWLVHDSCPLNGESIMVTGSWFSRLFLGEPRGYVADRSAFTPEAIRDHAEEAISLEDFAVHPDLGSFLNRRTQLLEDASQ